MRLTALCVCGTLLAFSSLSWTTVDSDEGDLLGDNGFGPCAATLRPEGPCRHGQDESMCPYLFSMPPLTVHLPKQLRELEKIVKDLQKLKDHVDQLRKMCADCTVSQTERECGWQREKEHEKLNEGMDRFTDERSWLNERNPERLKDFSQECGTDGVNPEKTVEEDGDSDSILEEKRGKKCEAERESDKGVVKGNENSKRHQQVAEKDGKTQAEGAKGKDKLGQTTVPTTGKNERIVDTLIKKAVEKNNRETEADGNKEKDGRGNKKVDPEDRSENGKERKIISDKKNKEKTEERDHPVWRDEQETEKKTETEEDSGSDGIKMSEDHDEHTNKEQEQHRAERKKEMEIKVERNNEKPEQTESIGLAEKEKTIKEGEKEEEADRETGKKIKTEGEKMVKSEQRDGDDELASSETTERTDFISISQTTPSVIVSQTHDYMDSNNAVTSAPSPPLSTSAPPLITGFNEGMAITADGQSLGSAGVSEHPKLNAEAGFGTTSKPTTATMKSTLGGPGQQITSVITRLTSETSTQPEAGRVSSTMATATTTTPHQNLNTTIVPGVADRSRWAAKKNMSSNTKTDVKPSPDRGPVPGEKHKPAIQPEGGRKPKNPKNDRKPDRAPLPDKKRNQKQRPSLQKPTTDHRSKHGPDPSRGQNPKPDQRPENPPTDPNRKNNQRPKPGQEHRINQNRWPKPHQKPIFPVRQRPPTVNTTSSDKDPRTVEIPSTNQHLKPRKSDKQKPHKKLKSEASTKPDQRSTLSQYSTVPDRRGPMSITPKPTLNPVTELIENSGENPLPDPKSGQDSSPGQKLAPDPALINPPDQRFKPGQDVNKKPVDENPSSPGQKLPPNPVLVKPNPSRKTPEINQKPNLDLTHPDQPPVKPKPDHTSQTNQGLETPRLDQMPNLNPKSVPDKISEAESNKLWPTVEPGATSDRRPEPSLRPRPKTITDLDLPQNTRTTSDSQTDMPPAPGPVKQIDDVTQSPGEFSLSETLGPQTSSSPETGPFPSRHTVPEDSTESPNSRITSDLRPQTAGQPPSIPVTTKPNKILPEIHPSVIPSTSPGSTKQKKDPDSGLHTEILHNVEEKAPRQTPDPDKMVSTVLDPRSTNQATSGPGALAPEASTASARELRVKINQVAAFFNNSPNVRLPDRRPIEHPEDSQGGSRPDSKLPTLKPSKVTMVVRDCSDYLLRGQTKSGVYLVTPDLRSRSFPVFCDMELDGGGWTLLQRRQDGSVSFNRTWAEYRSGFGELDGGEFWLGNNMIHLLTRDRDMMLRVELEDFEGAMEYAEYQQFRVASERLRYRLTVGGYSGTAGDALRFSKTYDHNNRPFTTPDRDHDRYPSGNCGAYYSSGWWFDACMAANLNGRYYVGKYKGVRDGIFWGTWHNISTEYYPTNERQSFKYVRMMIRPKGFTP